jgi:hypothetical protein
MKSVIAAHSLVFDRIHQDHLLSCNAHNLQLVGAVEASVQQLSEVTTKFVIPSRSAGCLIGQRGDNIRELHERSGARIQLKKRFGSEFEAVSLVKERIVEVSGSATACAQAVELCIKLLVDDSSQENPSGCLKYLNMTTSYSRALSKAFPSSRGVGLHSAAPESELEQFSQYQQGQTHSHPRADSILRHHHHSPLLVHCKIESDTIPVSESIVNSILGHRGERLAEIQRVSGAIVTMSPPPSVGCNHRSITVSGEVLRLQAAMALIKSRIATETDRQHRDNSIFKQIPAPHSFNFDPPHTHFQAFSHLSRDHYRQPTSQLYQQDASLPSPWFSNFMEMGDSHQVDFSNQSTTD